MSEVLIGLITLLSFSLVAFSMYVMYRSLKDTRGNDIDLVKKFADMLLAGDYKEYETFRGYNERLVQMNADKLRKPKVDDESMAIDNITRNLK